MSWEQALEKEKEMASSENEGFWLSHQVRNGKKTAILAIMDKDSKNVSGNHRRMRGIQDHGPGGR